MVPGPETTPMKPTPRRQRPANGALFRGADWTVLGPGSLVQGDMSLTGDVVIHGRLEGTLFADGEVLVAAEATVEGGIHARRVMVEGSCRGRIEGIEEVVLRPGSVVHADIDAGILTIDDHARFFGDCRVGDARPAPRVLSFENRKPGHA